VDPKIEETGPGRVRVRFVVNEGAPWKIVKLAFSGAKKVPEADLRKASSLQEGASFDAEKVERATLLLMELYFNRGMIMSRVAEPKRDVTSDGSVVLTWTIEESDVFRVGTVRFSKLGEKLQKELTAEMKTQPRAVFDRSKLVADLARIQAWFKARGQAVEAVPLTKLDAAKKTIDLELEIGEAR
jgi:outer membrane protein assembly factor BamA